jgi:hypothetical protein
MGCLCSKENLTEEPLLDNDIGNPVALVTKPLDQTNLIYATNGGKHNHIKFSLGKTLP